MSESNRSRSLVAGGILTVLLGLARGGGGLVLLLRGGAADARIQADGRVVAAVGAILLALGLGLIAAGLGTLRRRRRFWLWGMILTVLFLIDGAVNGWLLYGAPGAGGTVANIIAAAFILVLLVVGRSAAAD